MRIRAARAVGVATLAILLGAGTGAAQAGAAAVGLAGGYVEHAVAGGTAGSAFGIDGWFTAGGVTIRVGVRRMLLEGSAPATDALRAAAHYPALDIAGVIASPELHAGITRFSGDGDSGIVLAGGIGLRVAPEAPDRLRPYLSVRGLGGYTAGTIIGEDYSGGGLAVGVEAGLEADLGPGVARLTVARDGFDGGLGASPYPRTSAELAFGLRF